MKSNAEPGTTYSRLQDSRRRRGKRIEQWERPLLVCKARYLAKNPPTSAWGRSMRAKKGGYAVQRYRMEGRDPTAKEYMQGEADESAF